MKKFTFTLRWPIGDTRVVEWADTLDAARARLARKYPACEIFADEDIPVYLRAAPVQGGESFGSGASAAAVPAAARAKDQTVI